jgi:methionyl-tRNA formyltransferase
MGKGKRSTVGALEYLVERGCEVVAVVTAEPDGVTADPQRVDLAAERLGLRLCSDHDLYAEIEGGELSDVDLVVSFLFWKVIRAPLIELPRLGCLNFHPAPLPDLRGVGGYNVAVLEGWPEWGASAHFVAEQLDTGDLVAVERFPIEPEVETALSLDLKTQPRLLDLFRRVIDRALAGQPLPREPQGEGRYVSRAEFEELRRVPPDASPEQVERQIRAFWYPPYPGATLEVAGREVTLVDERLLAEVAAALRETGPLP